MIVRGLLDLREAHKVHTAHNPVVQFKNSFLL